MEGGTYKYMRVYREIKADIESGRLPVGSQVPSEERLGKLYDASRTTVRQALKLLIEEGLIDGRVGRGTVLPARGLGDDGPEQVMRKMRLWRETKGPGVLAFQGGFFETVPADKDVADHLGIEPGTEVYSPHWLLLVDGRAYSWSENFYREDLVPGLDRMRMAPSGRFYKAIRDELGVEITGGTDLMGASAANGTAARVLGLDEGEPVIVMERSARCRDGVFEYSRIYLHPEIYRMETYYTADELYMFGT